MSTPSITRLHHGRVGLALHHLRGGEGRPLLLLHGLGERTPSEIPAPLAPWPGPVVGLDLTGHGASDVPAGGGYYCEALMGDVDAALVHLGPVTIHGRGLGAYVALLIAGARATLVRGAILADGPGLAGGGPTPPAASILTVVEHAPPGGTPDPWAMHELTRDVRPPDYADTYARLASVNSGLDTALAVVGVNRPPWLEAVVQEPGVVECPLAEALERFAAVD